MKLKTTARLDGVGRVLIPRDYREALKTDGTTELSLELDGDALILRKAKKECVFCCNNADFVYNSVPVCDRCAERIYLKKGKGFVNKFLLTGRLVERPELRQTADGMSVTTIRVAVDRAGEEKHADFFSVVAWKGTAEWICRNFNKGQWIELECRLKNRTYEKDGKKAYTNDIVCESASFVGNRAGAERKEAAGGVNPAGEAK